MTRYIDADALMDRMYHDAFETDTDMQKWDSGCWTRYKMFENAIDEAPTADVVEVTDKSMIPLVKDFVKDLEKLGGRATCGDIIKSIKR